MLLAFFEREKGGLRYVRRDPTARLLDGQPDLTQGLIDTISGRQRFTAGVLSEITTLTPEVRGKAIRGADYQLRAGLPKESLSIAWLGHSGKGRDESHMVAANIELITGRPYSPYIDRIDRYRIRAWQEHFNLMHSLPDPSSRLRVRPDYTKSRLPAEHQKILVELWNRVHAKVESGLVTNRTELVAYLRSVGYNIRAETHEGKPLEQPVLTLSDGAILRLKGSCYYRMDFTPAMLLPKQEEVRPEFIRARINELRGTVARGLEFRAHHTVGRLFGRAEQRRVERGGARHHLAHLLQTKLEEWEIPEPVHPLFGPSGINDLFMLIELTNRGVDISKIPVLDKSNSSGMAPRQENSSPEKLPVSTPDSAWPGNASEQPSPAIKPDHMPTGIFSTESIQVGSTTNRTGVKKVAPTTAEITKPAPANFDPSPSVRRERNGRKPRQKKAPTTPGNLA